MATVAYTIHSHYDPVDSAEIEEAANISLEDDAAESSWCRASRDAFPHPRLQAPRFVPATLTHEGETLETSTTNCSPTSEEQIFDPSSSSAGFYRALMSKRNVVAPAVASTTVPAPFPRPASQPPPSSSSSGAGKSDPWFIRNVLHSSPAIPTSSSQSTTSLSEMLVRDPPPRAHEKPFKPRVWLALGPSNKGFSMLSQQGWQEGEALGLTVNRSAPGPAFKGKQKAANEDNTVELLINDGQVTELKKIEVVDLTGDDSGDSFSDSDPEDDFNTQNRPSSAPPASYPEPDGRKALITPLPIRLKSDRLGVGLKAKTEGPYKATKSRITPNAAALLAHAQAAEDLRRQKKIHGRGKKGFERKSKTEATKRQNLLAYLNS